MATWPCLAMLLQHVPHDKTRHFVSHLVTWPKIPRKSTGDGQDVSPELRWSDVPPGTKSFALICDDPDAPRKEPWVHWVVFNIPVGDQSALPEALPAQSTFPTGLKQGKSDFGKVGYGGPAPPPGKPHRYYFKLYALDTTLNLGEGVTKAELQSAMKGHVLGQGELMGTYSR
jgi:Raf kinase inhibitor-like YbhB/YbcL family protein